MHLAITPLLLLIGTALLVTVLAEREQELSYYGISGDGRPAESSSAGLTGMANNNNNPVSGTGQDAEPPESEHSQAPTNQQQLLSFELLLPRLVALARHRFLSAGARPYWLGEQSRGNDEVNYGPMVVDNDEEDAADRVGIDRQYNEIEKCKTSECNDILTVKRDRTPILSIQAPIESLRQRIQWELRKKQEERNRKILDSIKRKLHYD